MNQRDTDRAGIQKYKNIFFYIFVIQILWTIFGNIYCRQAYFLLSVPIIAWGFIKLVQMVVIQFCVNLKFHSIVKQYQTKRSCIAVQNNETQKQINHAFIIPNFKEEIQILRETLKNLSSHLESGKYMIFLGMEKAEQEAETKAKSLISQFSNKFKFISYTIHQLKKQEKKGKPSNIDYCARQLKTKLLQQNLTTDSTLVHIMDADSLMPQLYIYEVQNHLRSNYDKKDTFLYQPPQVFTRNDEEANIFVRYVDNYMSSMQSSQLYSLFGFTFGVSNYSISYSLLQKIDFFDTFQYSQTQDARTPLKCFWKTNGEAKCIPIYTPFNQLNLQTHNGFLSNLKTKIYQMQRHAEAHFQFPYCLDQFIRGKGCSLTKIYVVFAVFEMIMLHFVLTIPFIVIILQDKGFLQQPELTPENFLLYINILMTVPIMINMIQFEIFKVMATRSLYKKDKSFSFFIVIISILGILLITLIGFFTMVISFCIVFGNNTAGYEVTAKSVKTKKSLSGKTQLQVFHQSQLQQERFIKSQILQAKNQEQIITNKQQN